MKKSISIVLVIALLCGALAACAIPADEVPETTEAVSTSEFPGDPSTEVTTEKITAETTAPPKISETESVAERILREFREDAQNNAEIDWMLAKADPLPELEISDVEYQRIVALTHDHPDASEILQYYGTYGEATVLYTSAECGGVWPPHTTCLASGAKLELSYTLTVGDFTLCYPRFFALIALVDSSIYTLKEAYELGYLTEADLQTIRDYHRRVFQISYPELIEEQVFPEWDSFYPERDTTWIGGPLYNETDLSWMLEEPDPLPELEQPSFEHLKELNTWNPFSHLALNSEYYGTYNGAEVYLCPGVTATGMCIYVGTACFYRAMGFGIYVYKNGEMFTLREAYYLEEIITDEDLETILGYHHIRFYN